MRASASPQLTRRDAAHLLNKLGLRDRVQAVVILTERTRAHSAVTRRQPIHPDDRLDTAVSQQGGSQTKYLTLAPQGE